MGGNRRRLEGIRSRIPLAGALGLGILLIGLAAMGPASASHVEAPLTEIVVTGHTTLASNYGAGDGPRRSSEERPPTPTVRLDGQEEGSPSEGRTRNECVAWFNGGIVFDATHGFAGIDWDSSRPPAADPDDDIQTNDNTLDPCGTIVGGGFIGTTNPTDFAIVAGLELGGGIVAAVESGDCDPREATAARFHRDLSFTDPNGQTHLVAEIRYTCFSEGLLSDMNELAEGELGASNPGHVPNSPQSSDGDPTLSDGQRHGAEAPLLGQPLLNETFSEYAWVTMAHAVIRDPSLHDGACSQEVQREDSGFLGADPTEGRAPDEFDAGPVRADLWNDRVAGGREDFCAYNFALMVDTCNDNVAPGYNPRSPSDRCTDGGGEEFLEDDDNDDGKAADPQEAVGPRFDDSARDLVTHDGCPRNHDGVRDGNSNRDFTDAWNCLDNHREDKTADWTLGPGWATETDYDAEEDHLRARVDLYVFFENCYWYYTALATAFCENIEALSPMIVNHPGCWNPEEDAVLGDICWNLPGAQDDAAGTGGREAIERTFGST